MLLVAASGAAPSVRFVQSSGAMPYRRSRSVWGVVGSLVGIALASTAACSTTADADVPNPNGKDPGVDCATGAECKSLACAAGKCAAVGTDPTLPAAPAKPDDGIKNGDESDVDCGGANAPKCALDKGCNADTDCTTTACSYAKKCVAWASCTAHFGGDTCGEGDTGSPDEKHESCCTTVTNSAGLKIGKYHITAGRMRAFVERYNGNLQQWAYAAPKGWDESWTEHLPKTLDEAHELLGASTKRGCSITPDGQGGRTYWQPAVGEEKNDFPKDVLDEKALNCVTWYMAQALCVSDGGRLPTSSEVQGIMTNDGDNEYPWQFQDSSDFDEDSADDRLVHNYSYATPNPPADMRSDGDDPLDRSFWIAPPGRRPSGANKIGVQDAVGLMLPWLNEEPNSFAWTMSWEEHPKSGKTNVWPNNLNVSQSEKDSVRDGYYAIGARCVFE